jgi:hypothetical protein
MSYPKNNNNNTHSSTWTLAVLLSLGLFVGAVLGAEIPGYGMDLSLALVVLGGFGMLISGIHREQIHKKDAVAESIQLESDF